MIRLLDINIQFHTTEEVMGTKGEKPGHFTYGGSWVTLLFEKGRFNSVSVQQGQQIGIFNQEIK